jgi:hypothetical protein
MPKNTLNEFNSRCPNPHVTSYNKQSLVKLVLKRFADIKRIEEKFACSHGTGMIQFGATLSQGFNNHNTHFLLGSYCLRAGLFKDLIVYGPDCLRDRMFKVPIVTEPDCAGSDCAWSDSIGPDLQD